MYSESQELSKKQAKHKALVVRTMAKHKISKELFANLKAMYAEIRAYCFAKKVKAGKIKGGRAAYRAYYTKVMAKHKISFDDFKAIKAMYASIKANGAKKTVTAASMGKYKLQPSKELDTDDLRDDLEECVTGANKLLSKIIAELESRDINNNNITGAKKGFALYYANMMRAIDDIESSQ